MHAPLVVFLGFHRFERLGAVRAFVPYLLEVLRELYDDLVVVIRDQCLEPILLQCLQEALLLPPRPP